MTKITTLAEAAIEVLKDIERVGFNEAMGLEEIPAGRVINTDHCKCRSGCGSVLECDFWYWVRKTEMMERKAHRQVTTGPYRVDCLFDCDGQQVVVELDGKAFHQDKEKERQRDQYLLKHFDAVIHIPYAAMHFYEHATFQVLASWYPRFQLRGIDTLCLTLSEFEEELSEVKARYSEDNYLSPADWCKDVEQMYQLWNATSTSGWVGSVAAHLNRWNVTPITHARRKNPCT